MSSPSPRSRTGHVDPDTLAELRAFDEDGGILGELIDIYLKDTPERMMAIAEALGCTDARGLMEHAHTLKSSCAQLGAMALSEHFKHLETLGREGTTEGAASLLSAAEEEFRAVRAELIWAREDTPR